MNSLPAYVEKYLKKYSSGPWHLEADNKNKINAAVIIPAISEYENIKRLFKSLSENDPAYLERSLIIFVINNFASSEKWIKNENAETIRYIRSIMSGKKINIGLADASSKGMEMPEKEGGVGLARKIGMDLALTAFDYSPGSKNILVSLDADCRVERNYFSEIFSYFNTRRSGAAVLKSRHEFSEKSEETRAIIYYEIYLRFYVLGLRFAGSKYAFHTIGSTFACDCENYIKAEGMNKRKAGEDFYFLQKIAKNTAIGRINSTTLFPASRVSWRVPFGTGAKISQFKSSKENYLLYNPVLFRILKDWLSVFSNNETQDVNRYLSAAEKISPVLLDFLLNQGFKKDIENILKNSITAAQLEKQKLKWFDGFRTLKLMHFLREKQYPMINMFEALNIFLDWIKFKDKPNLQNRAVPPLHIQKEYLEILRNLDDR